MRLSEFRHAVTEEFGDAYGRVLVNDLVLAELGDLSAAAALDAGIAPSDVWKALCAANGVPISRRHGVGLPSRQA